jgi:hypothetical protein
VSVVREPLRMAVLDDNQSVAVSMADWSSLDGRVTIIFSRTISAMPTQLSRASGLSELSM